MSSSSASAAAASHGSAKPGEDSTPESARPADKPDPTPAPTAALPVTVLSGFLGSGKTTLLKHILTGEHGLRVAVIVNDMAELNIDASIAAEVVRSEEQLTAMQNGCICCTLREDLLVEVTRLAHSGKFDYIVIESTGVSEPLPVAETFTFDTGDGKPLQKVAKLDTMVTMVDTAAFGENLDSFDSLESRGWQRDDADKRTIAHLLIDQLEFADVVVLNKMDLVDDAVAHKVEGIVRRLNPAAKILRATKSAVPLKEVLNTGRFSMDDAARAPGWLREARGEHVPETEEYGVSSFVFRADKPFNPARLRALVESDVFSASPLKSSAVTLEGSAKGGEDADKDGDKDGGASAADARAAALDVPPLVAKVRRGEEGVVIRSKGVAWLSGPVGDKVAASWSHSGRLLELSAAGLWGTGKKRTTVVIIGVSMKAKSIEAALEWALDDAPAAAATTATASASTGGSRSSTSSST